MISFHLTYPSYCMILLSKSFYYSQGRFWGNSRGAHSSLGAIVAIGPGVGLRSLSLQILVPQTQILRLFDKWLLAFIPSLYNIPALMNPNDGSSLSPGGPLLPPPTLSLVPALKNKNRREPPRLQSLMKDTIILI